MSHLAINPPQPPPIWSHTPEALNHDLEAAITSAKHSLAAVAALEPSECSFSSVFVALAQCETALEAATEPLFFYQNVATSSELRDAASAAEVKFLAFQVDTSMRVDIYQAKLNAKKTIDASGEKLVGEDARLVEKMLLDGKRAGLSLPEAHRALLAEKKKILSQKCVEFTKNFNEENGYLSFTSAELHGVPQDVISAYKKHEGQDLYDVTYKTPDIMPIYKFATNPDTRMRVFVGSENRLAVNVPVLEEILALRREIASLLGYKTWADYVIENKMAKTAQAVNEFLDDLRARLTPVAIVERENLLALKKEECNRNGLPFEDKLYIWDWRYYDRLYTERTLDLDTALIKQYFPVDFIVPTVIQVYQDLLGVRFETLKGGAWHPEVQQFSVWEADAKDESGFLGYCYLDLFPREAKYSHAAVWQLISGRDKTAGGRDYPVAAMVANLAKPTEQNEALMTHDDVVTFFHEMGHAFHGLLSKTRYGRFHGTSTARDFVEAPSQMLENWCFEPKVLQKMSSHYQTKQPLSKELIEKLIKSRSLGQAMFFLRQNFFAQYDIQLHSLDVSGHTTQLWNELRQEISLVTGPQEQAPGQGSFGHLTSYDAGYYGYVYSLVFAADFFETVFKADPLSPKLGQLYREKILRPGSSRDEMESVQDFLGRKPNMKAFLKMLFGEQGGSEMGQVKNSL